MPDGYQNNNTEVISITPAQHVQTNQAVAKFNILSFEVDLVQQSIVLFVMKFDANNKPLGSEHVYIPKASSASFFSTATGLSTACENAIKAYYNIT